MRILHFIDNGFEAGGAEKLVRLVSEGLTARGHVNRVVATDRMADGERVFADDLVPAITGSGPRRLARKLWYARGRRQAGAVLEEFRPDCVHLHCTSEFSPSLFAATAGYPRVLSVQGPEDWTLGLLRWQLTGAPAGERLSASDLARYGCLRFVQRPAYLPRVRRVDRILVPSRYFARAVARDAGPVPVHVVPNGIERKTPPRPLTTADHVVVAGRLVQGKGVGVLLEAMRRLLPRHPSARLTVVGDGPHRPALESAAADLVAARRARFRGWLGEAEVLDCLGDAAVVAVPSLWPENFPTVALEALQVGRPLVASRVGGLPELVGPDNGVLVPAGDPVRLAGALGGLLGRPGVLERMGAASAVRAERYGIGEFLDALEHHYRQAAAHHHRRQAQGLPDPRGAARS